MFNSFMKINYGKKMKYDWQKFKQGLIWPMKNIYILKFVSPFVIYMQRGISNQLIS